MQNENAKCPFCGSRAEEHDNHLWLSCINDDCLLSRILFTPKDWDTRPLESTLLQRAEKAEAKRDAAIAENAKLKAALQAASEAMNESQHTLLHAIDARDDSEYIRDCYLILDLAIANAKEALAE
jgi:hypothetical protein